MSDEFNLHITNYFFYAFHGALILFNLLGWIFPKTKTRKLNLITLLLTFSSWFILGIWKGWGYCFLTDWHYDVLRKLGNTDLPNSYIAFLVEKLTGYLPDTVLIETLTLGVAVLVLICSLYVNFRLNGKRKRS